MPCLVKEIIIFPRLLANITATDGLCRIFDNMKLLKKIQKNNKNRVLKQ